jgi:hypothetical protein
MGGRLGLKMEKAIKKDEALGINAAHNQTVRHEDESIMPNEDDDDEPAVIEDDSDDQSHRRGGRNMVEREPEREPDQSMQEGNITKSILDKEKGITGKSNMRALGSGRAREIGEHSQDDEEEVDVDPDEEDMNANHIDLSPEGSLGISESNESMME